MERLTAGLIVLLCLVTAIGNWAIPPRERAPDQGAIGDRLSFSRHDLAEIDVVGGIVSRGGVSSSTAASVRIIQQLRQAAKDKVKGILLNIDSPGGSAAACQEVYQEVRTIHDRYKIPVVCSMGDIAASGGYYIAAATDEIVANRATLTGSIGVIMYLFNAKGLLDKVGIEPEVIKTGPFKDIASPYRTMTPDERALLQGVINSTYQQFLSDVAAGRKMTVAQVEALAGGRIYTGVQAKENHLVDTLGTHSDAVRILARRAGITGEPSIRNYSKGGWQSWFDDFSFDGRGPNIPMGAFAGLATKLWQAQVPLTLYDTP